MPDLGKKYTCYSCHTKFYDLGKPIPLCPKCGADQREAEDVAPAPVSRSRAARAPVVVEEPIDDNDLASEAESPVSGDEEEEEIIPDTHEEEADEEEEEEY